MRWQAAKRRCRVGDDDDDEQLEIPDIEELTPAIDNTVITATSRSIACQTDLTLKHINDMESDYHQLKGELEIAQENNGYPQIQQLESNSELLYWLSLLHHIYGHI